MGPKLNLSNNGWGVCKQCRCYLAPSDVSKHVNSCHGSASRNSSDSPQTPANRSLDASVINQQNKYGFIRNDILHGFAREKPKKGEELDKLPVFLAVDIVLLHPSLMTLCQVSIGSLVLVWINRDKFVFQRALPSKDCSLTDVGLSTQIMQLLDCKPGDVMHVQRLMDTDQRPAEVLVLGAKDLKPFYSSDEFATYFRHIFGDKLVTVGESLFINYHGQPCQLKVAEISRGSHIVSYKRIDLSNVSISASDSVWSESEVCDSFSELSINKSSVLLTPGETLVMTSTPKRKLYGVLCSCESHKPELAGSVSYVHAMTRVRFNNCENESKESKLPKMKRISFEDIGGLTKQIEEIKRLLFLPKEGHQLFSSYGLQPPRGIVLFGVPGTGKTMIGCAVANVMQQNFVSIKGPELFSKFYGETEAKLRDIFNEAKMRAPCVIFIDEIDSLCPKRGSSSTQQEQRVVATLLTLMDTLPTDPGNRVIILAATNKLDLLDPAMRRPGRLDREIEIGIPTSFDRVQITKNMLKNVSHNLRDEEINEIASNTHGYVGADLEAMCSQAGLNALSRIRSQSGSSSSELPECTERMKAYAITYSDMVQAAKEIKPSGLREVLIEIPKVHWDDVGGQEELKHKLKQAVEWPLKHPEVFQRMGIVPPKGILMYGPPGCSKTLIAKALATESRLNFIAIKGPELFSKWVGESESAIREVFRKARAAAPSIVFFDEIDALAAERGSSSGSSNVGDRVLAQLLSEMDGLEKLNGVTVIASTNRPDMIDTALLRPGRLDRIVYVSLPDAKTRHDIFDIQFRRIPIATDVQTSDLVERTEGYSGAEIVAVCREAALKVMEESLAAHKVFKSHFLHALKVVQPRTSQDLIKFYETYSVKGNTNSS